MLSYHTPSNSMSAKQDQQSSGYGQDLSLAMSSTSFDTTNMTTTAPLAFQQQYGPTTGYFDNFTTATTSDGSQHQYAPVYNHNTNQSGLQSVGTTTNIGQPDFQHQNHADAYAQVSRPGLDHQQLQLQQYHQQQMAQAMQAQASQYMPYNSSPQQQTAASLDMLEMHARQQIENIRIEKIRMSRNLMAQYNLDNQAGTPIERSQSDMGPQTATQSFGPFYAADSDCGIRPGSSKSMGNLQFMSGMPQRPFTPYNQTSESINATSPFNPVTPSHDVESEAIDLTKSVASTPHTHPAPVAWMVKQDDLSQLAGSGRSVADPEYWPNGSPSKLLGAPFSRLSVNGDSTHESQMDASSPDASDLSDIEDPKVEIIYVPTGITEAEISSHLADNDNDKYPFKCLFDGCGKVFQRKENGKNHIQTHLGDAPYICSRCGRKFPRHSDAKRHTLNHSKFKGFVCGCGFAVARKDALDRHQERIACIYMAQLRPDLAALKTPSKRGRPKKNHSVDEGRVTKSPSKKTKSPSKKSPSKKTQRKRAEQVADAMAREASPSPAQKGTMTPASYASPVMGNNQTTFTSQRTSIDESYAPAQQNHMRYAPVFQSWPPVNFNDSGFSLSMTMELSETTEASSSNNDSVNDHFSAPMPQLNDSPVMLNNSVSFTPPMSPTGAFSTGVNSPSKHSQEFINTSSHDTPPGSPPDLSMSPEASSMGEELPSAAYHGDLDEGLFAAELKNYLSRDPSEEFFNGSAGSMFP